MRQRYNINIYASIRHALYVIQQHVHAYITKNLEGYQLIVCVCGGGGGGG